MTDNSDANVEGLPIPCFSNSLTRVASVYLPCAFVSFGCAYILFHDTVSPTCNWVVIDQSSTASTASTASTLFVISVVS